ncbi:hypothetical protein E5344_11010 [Microbacterium laevaniformans]|uniref:ATP-binding protein n=1 Tax=Microbacterium laevaniformans TaxID=36807 RepID=A0A4S2D617_9MICO|nr:ATP-binding protein [Microbacterium laevaniformans]TGY36291.1 hypothetical protein E5344_11010 [Microbacterium laevaniformans]
MTANDEAAFTFSWLALKLLGRGLYSNPWSALSELVANGLDAQAQRVFVYVDARDRAHATVEVIDDGSGMSRDDINTYVKVGHNKRKEARSAGITGIKGRKGIGKLAALFLSQHFYLITKHSGELTSWELDAREGKVVDDENPKLLAVENLPESPNDLLWSSLDSGTRLVLNDVDLTGYGPQSIAALGSRLANQFLLPVASPPQILMAVRLTDSVQPAEYMPVAKSVAFRNLAEGGFRLSAQHR